uniref:Spindle pole body component n=3 Tax=Spongospora subterranea TaxID=70186 RepID=A0A0H5QZQ3_9EUKA|eukprot:CRZ07380.1 hypothetical protein [Spongospora subterranea]
MLMGYGDLFDSFCESLFLISPLPTATYINRLFISQVSSSQYNHEDIGSMKFLAVDSNQKPADLSGFRFVYTVNESLIDIISQQSLDGYSTVFGFLLQVKRIAFALRIIWQGFRQSSLSVRQFLFVQRMRHFFVTLQDYITSEVLNKRQCEFQSNLAGCQTAGEVRELHDLFIVGLLNGFFLSAKTKHIGVLIRNIFAIILGFETMVGQKTSLDGDLFNHCVDRFDSDVAFLHRVQERLVLEHGTALARDLLLRLDFNSFYHNR